MTGSALAQVLATQAEYKKDHYHVEGTPTVLNQKVIAYRPRSPRIVVAACIDNAHVKVVDRKGHAAPAPAGPSRAINLLVLVKKHGQWVVSRTAFPANPAC